MSVNAEKIARFLADTFELDCESLDTDLPLFSSGLLDSTSLIELVEFLEIQSGIEVEADDLTLENYDTIDLIIDFYNR